MQSSFILSSSDFFHLSWISGPTSLLPRGANFKYLICSIDHHQAGWGRRTDCIRSCLCSHHRAHLWVCNLTSWHNLGEQQWISASCVLLLHSRWIYSVEFFQSECLYFHTHIWYIYDSILLLKHIVTPKECTVCDQTWNLSKNLHCRILRLQILHRQFHLISTVLVGKKHKKWVKMEKFTPLAKILHCRRQWRHGQIPPLR